MKHLILALGLTSSLTVATDSYADETAAITVYKSPTCGCCTDWVRHLEDNGFAVQAINTQDLHTIKAEAGLTPALASCHTAFVGDYVIEGHVRASDIRRLLAEGLPARGLSVPGMPVGSPGMEMGDRQDAYQVLLFNDQGQTRVYAEHP
ncbi:DUF411 domain-containing protein [Marinobacter sp. SS21]|uniref:DUF411 domain-containing protein n=1 Tax=Marinobacter sp. SS21 TaxID=2979460 RepID=UPI002330EFFE|nr:DUF411 domain-containing protein [Marinobacter sp. SS21]MDC0662830.1 DUF411 domain-containing protein [Marinobacter sp. SS21]